FRETVLGYLAVDVRSAPAYGARPSRRRGGDRHRLLGLGRRLGFGLWLRFGLFAFLRVGLRSHGGIRRNRRRHNGRRLIGGGYVQVFLLLHFLLFLGHRRCRLLRVLGLSPIDDEAWSVLFAVSLAYDGKEREESGYPSLRRVGHGLISHA